MDQYNRARRSSATPLSLEASLDEENREVLAVLAQQRSHSPVVKKPRNRTPPPYRSMLDVEDSSPRHGSIAGIGVGITSPTSPRDRRKISKRLDPGDPSTWTKPAKPTSPTTTRTYDTTEPPEQETSPGLPKIQIDSRSDFEQNYNFDISSIPRSGGGAIPMQEKRNKDGNSSPKPDVSARRASKELKSSNTIQRSSSPNVVMLSPESPRPKPRTSSTGAEGDAERRLSNKSNSFSTVDGSEGASSRVLEDNDADEDAVEESSSDDEKRASSSDEDSPDTERGRSRAKDEVQMKAEDESPTEARVAPQSQGVKSLIEPLLSPSVPHDKSSDIHPSSSFGKSGPTAADFAEEDEYEADIQKAKNMGMSISPLDDSIADRHVRMIIRGEWSKFQDENENNNNSSPRLYLACTDLSTEASYAMEWTVGTMLRDGDTLLAIYSIEDENAPKEPEGNVQVNMESAKAAQDASDAMETLTRKTTGLESKPMTKFIPAIEAPTLAGSTDLKNMPKKEAERLKALDEITQNFLKLVRKTPLQIRCMIEVIHCKSPKHLILNAIDALEPTLCVVGTRGRSSLKGVLLGSFSNYLVTKSSVPVMVARKRLKKPHHAKVNSTSIRLTNNLTNSIMPRARRNLASARID